eukprot:scaffold3619_cov328-Prasinococcus_capsulatus_cf.AAC.3
MLNTESSTCGGSMPSAWASGAAAKDTNTAALTKLAAELASRTVGAARAGSPGAAPFQGRGCPTLMRRSGLAKPSLFRAAHCTTGAVAQQAGRRLPGFAVGTAGRSPEKEPRRAGVRDDEARTPRAGARAGAGCARPGRAPGALKYRCARAERACRGTSPRRRMHARAFAPG